MDFFKSNLPFLLVGIILGSILWYTCGWIAGLLGFLAPIAIVMGVMFYIMGNLPK